MGSGINTTIFTGRSGGRIILLGDGTEVLTDSDDIDMFDNDEEEKDLASQVDKRQGITEDGKGDEGKSKTNVDEQSTKTSSEHTPASNSTSSQLANHAGSATGESVNANASDTTDTTDAAKATESEK
jgi:protein phosphatase 2C family protein 2/3